MTSNNTMLQTQDGISKGKTVRFGMCEPMSLSRNIKIKKDVIKLIHKFHETKRQVLSKPPSSFRFQELYIYLFLKQTPPILQVTDAFLEDSKICVVTKDAALGILKNYVERCFGLTKVEACCFFQQLMNGIHRYHKQSKRHRGSNPSNILLHKNGPILISDSTNATICPMSAPVASKTDTLTGGETKVQTKCSLHKATSFNWILKKDQTWKPMLMWKIKKFHSFSFIQAMDSSFLKKRCWSAGELLNVRASPVLKGKTSIQTCKKQSKHIGLKNKLHHWLTLATRPIVRATKNKKGLKWSRAKLLMKWKTWFSSISTSVSKPVSNDVHSCDIKDVVISDSVSSVGSSTLSPTFSIPAFNVSAKKKPWLAILNYCKEKKFKLHHKLEDTLTFSSSISTTSTSSFKCMESNQSDDVIKTSPLSKWTPKLQFISKLFKKKSTSPVH